MIVGTTRPAGQMAQLCAQTPEMSVNWPPMISPQAPALMERTPQNWLNVGRKFVLIAPDAASTASSLV